MHQALDHPPHAIPPGPLLNLSRHVSRLALRIKGDAAQNVSAWHTLALRAARPDDSCTRTTTPGHAVLHMMYGHALVLASTNEWSQSPWRLGTS